MTQRVQFCARTSPDRSVICRTIFNFHLCSKLVINGGVKGELWYLCCIPLSFQLASGTKPRHFSRATLAENAKIRDKSPTGLIEIERHFHCVATLVHRPWNVSDKHFFRL